MDYQVELAAEAAREVEAIVSRIWKDAPLEAVRWQERLQAQWNLLTYLPGRFALAAESEVAPCPVRQLIFGKYRILYSIRASKVFVLAVRHGHRLPITAAELRRRLEP